MLKRCARCKELLSYAEFNKHKSTKDGLQCYCLDCHKKAMKASRLRAAPEQQKKRCRTCGDVKALIDFHRNAVAKSGRRSECIDCRRFTKRIAKYKVAASDPMFRSTVCQNDECQEPLSWDRQTHIDHCHKTGEVRGVLCMRCNLSLGNAGDSPEKLRGLADYAEKTNGNVAEAGDGTAAVVGNVSLLRRLLVALFGLPSRHGGASHRRGAEQVEGQCTV